MADNKPTTTTTANVPMPSKYNWLGDRSVTNSPPMNSPPKYSMLSQSPPAGGDMNAANNKRRDSLKNMVHLCDFATP